MTNKINCQTKIEQSGGASRWRVCYQRGLPRLVFFQLTNLSRDATPEIGQKINPRIRQKHSLMNYSS